MKSRIAGAALAVLMACSCSVPVFAAAPPVQAAAASVTADAAVKPQKVTLNMSEKIVKVGQSVRLKATVLPAGAAKKAVWKSSKESVARVSNAGVVKALKTGKATITCTIGGKKAKATIRVVTSLTGKNTPVKGVKLDSGSKTLGIGETAALKATVTPAKAGNKKVSWASSNDAVASVNGKGVVTAKSAGTASITVTTSEGGKTAQCTVTVSPAAAPPAPPPAETPPASQTPPASSSSTAQPVAVTGVSLDMDSIALFVGETEQLTATVSPANADDTTVGWDSDEEAIATVDSTGMVTAVASGTTTITVTTVDGGKTATCAVTVTSTQDIADEFANANSVVLGKTTGTIAIADKGAVQGALDAYDALDDAVKAHLLAEHNLLLALMSKIEQLETAAAANAFRTTHSAVLSKTTESIAIGDKAAVQAALNAYNASAKAVRDLLGSEKTKLDSLLAAIGTKETAAAADTFRTAHSAVLSKTTESIAIGDKAAVQAALSAYNALAKAVRDLLGDEKTKLDSLLAAIGTKETAAAADTFRTDHSEVLGKTTESITIGDKTAVQAALSAYNALAKAVRDLLGDEKTQLDSLLAAIGTKEIAAAADTFRTDHSVALGKTTGSITIGDKDIVQAALDDFDASAEAVKALLGDEKTLLDSLMGKITELEEAAAAVAAANAFKSTHSGVLGKTTGNIVATDKTAVQAALNAYDALNAATQALLVNEKALLDDLMAEIVVKQTAASAAAFSNKHSDALQLTVDGIRLLHEKSVLAALEDYGKLADPVKALLVNEKALLDSLANRCLELHVLSDANQEAISYRKNYSEILAKTVSNIAISDRAAVQAALNYYATKNSTVQDMLSAEKALLDSLMAKIVEMEAVVKAGEFRTAHSVILGKRVEDIRITDEDAVQAALAAYDVLDEVVKSYLQSEKVELDKFAQKVQEKKVSAAFSAFLNEHPVLNKRLELIQPTDRSALEAAKTAYEQLSEDVKNAYFYFYEDFWNPRMDRVIELENAAIIAAFENAHSYVFSRNVDNVYIWDKPEVLAALEDYATKSEAEKTLLIAQKTKLDELRDTIAEQEFQEFHYTHGDLILLSLTMVTLEHKPAIEACQNDYNALDDMARSKANSIHYKYDEKLGYLWDKILELEARQ